MIDKNSTIQGANVPVGYAHEDLKILLLDENGNKVRPGEAGEIAVRSRFLSPGYWRMPELTKARLLPDPSSRDEKIYLSGDLGRMTPEGCLFHLGRKDLQVKIRGYRVEVAEVERVLVQHPGVKEAVVACQEDRFAQPRLVAYWIPNEWPGPTVSELRRCLRKAVPNYMIPSAFMILEAMPLLPTGKLDRGALPSPDDSRPNLDHLCVAPATQIEKELVRIWGEVLGIKQVGIHDAFSDLGGDSLQATQVISRILMAFQVELPISFLLTSPTIAEMASVIMTHQGKKLGDKELTRILSELESLSDKDAQRLLAGQASDEHERD